MAHGRVGITFALLFALAGAAAAQPGYPGMNYGGPTSPAIAGGPSTPFLPPGVPGIPSPMPGPAYTASPSGSNGPSLSGMADDHPPVRELALPDLIPTPDKHHGHSHGCDACGEGHEIPGFMTPFFSDHGGWFTNGEFLLMRPRYTDFDYAILNRNPGLSTTGPINSLKYDTGTGLRAELGYRYGEGKWESAFAYTYFTSNGDSITAAGANQVLFPTLTRPGLTDRALTATTNADLDYQLYDMLIGRRMLVEENFAVRWIGGFRFSDIRQTFNAFYDGADARRAVINTRSRFQGFGPLIGAEAVLVGWKGLHFYARAFGGLLTGTDSNRLIETNDNGQTTYVNTQYDIRKVVPMGSIALGGGWQYRTISIRAGYEVTHWQGIFERPRFVDDVSQGKVITRPANLTLEGLFIQVGLSF